MFTFGIGSDCQKDLVKESAEAGKGKSYFASHSNRNQIKDQVIDALYKASQPALVNCKFNFVDKDYELGSLFRNEIVQVCTILSEEKFQALNCKFECEYDPKSKKEIYEEFDSSRF